jgi:hypothetical protein
VISRKNGDVRVGETLINIEDSFQVTVWPLGARVPGRELFDF